MIPSLEPDYTSTDLQEFYLYQDLYSGSRCRTNVGVLVVGVHNVHRI